MTLHRIQTQRDPDIEVLIPEASFTVGFQIATSEVVRQWRNHGLRTHDWCYFGHYIGTVEVRTVVPEPDVRGLGDMGL